MDCQAVCPVVPFFVVELALPILAHKPDAMLHLHRRLFVSAGAEHPAFGMRSWDRVPLHLELAGPVRQLADADG